MNLIRPTVEEQNTAIRLWCSTFADFLCNKNIAYGGQALAPLRIVSKASPLAGIEIRIDDKLNRLINGEDAGEDPLLDLCGYIILREVGKNLYKKPDGPVSPEDL